MPVEIKEILIKATVENKTQIEQKADKAGISMQGMNIDLLLSRISKKIKSQNER